MPLLEFWKSSPTHVSQLTIEQVIVTAGGGELIDDSLCSHELRDYFSKISNSKIAIYIEHCLSRKFDKSGMVLQDLVNELGKRLDYKVSFGRYQGIKNAIGFDGLWLSPEGHSIVIESKTTDTFRISLETIGDYRRKLVETRQISGPSSILIVVGRQDTGELEAQIRGSRLAAEIRLISADALIKLAQTKLKLEGNETGRKMRSLLIPIEHTRLDKLIDVMFTTAEEATAAADIEPSMAGLESGQEDVENQSSSENAVLIPAIKPLDAPHVLTPDHPQTGTKSLPLGEKKTVRRFIDQELQNKKREKMVLALGLREKTTYIQKNTVSYWNFSHDKRLICAVASAAKGKLKRQYWYGYSMKARDFLTENSDGFLILGCMDLDNAFAIPASVMEPILDTLSTTLRYGRVSFWHITIVEQAHEHFVLLVPNKSEPFLLNKFQLNLAEADRQSRN